MRILKIEYVLLLNKLCTVKTSHRSQMIPKKFLQNTSLSVQLHALPVTPLNPNFNVEICK